VGDGDGHDVGRRVEGQYQHVFGESRPIRGPESFTWRVSGER
jgi:hypothetical protein